MKAYFFEDKETKVVRRTPVFANNLEEAKSRLRRPSPEKARVVKVREITEAEKKASKNGRWVSSRTSKDFADSRGFGPKPKK